MKIVHVCLAAFYLDKYSYQENMLPKFHKELGYDVEIIASIQGFDEHGKVSFSYKPGSYENEYGIKVTRLPYKSEIKLWKKLKRYKNVKETLEESHCNILFIHGCQFLDIDQIVIYLKKNPSVKVYVDNHADFSNSATNWFSKNILHKIVWKKSAHMIEPYTTRFYGVLPARVDFLEKVYKLPKSKCELLVMGADNELVKKARDNNACSRIRNQYGIKPDDFLIVTGGKIDRWKKQIIDLMAAVRNMKDDHVRLIVFGSVTQELKEQVLSLSDGEKVQYIGWMESKDTYDYFAAADLAVFPGRHSVLWEQVAGQGIPMIVKDWAGTHHIDLGGNVIFLKKDGAPDIQKEIEILLHDSQKYNTMKTVAREKGMKYFSYRDIAERSIGA